MRVSTISVLLTTAAAACGGGDGGLDAPPPVIDAARPDATAVPPDAEPGDLPGELPTPLPAGAPSLSAITFNVGQIQTVNGAPERMAAILPALADSGADVVCLQEVYTQPPESTETGYTTPAGVAATLAATYPYAAWSEAGVNRLSNGLLILSKHPLYRRRFLRFETNDPNEIVDRAALAATVVADAWHVAVVCTHIQAGIDADGIELRQAELAELGAFVEAEGYADGPTVLLGDFNAGPAPTPPPAEPECPGQGACPSTCTPPDTGSIDLLTTTYGWAAPVVANTACTYCKAESTALAFVNLFPCEGSQVIDHCFHRGLGAATITQSARVLDAPVSIPYVDPVGTATTLSDHYALRCTIAAP
jgi:endonuclease/exonuclease/phosphatase family metal-dependent hydrolase